jgi:hypothetical protein
MKTDRIDSWERCDSPNVQGTISDTIVSSWINNSHLWFRRSLKFTKIIPSFLAYFPYFVKIEQAYEISCCLCIPPIVARQRLGKSPLIVARQQLGKNPPNVSMQQLGRNVTAVTNTHPTIEELLDPSFLMWPVSYQGESRRLVLPRTSCLNFL